MRVQDAPVVDARPVMARDREDLLAFLADLDEHEWLTPTAAPGWRVKEVALHLLDDDLGWLSRQRDADRSGLLSGFSDHGGFVAALAAKNQRWVEGASGLSRQVVADLLRWSGAQMDDHVATRDLRAEAHVDWAGDDPVPAWLDLARELTERWVHPQQMRLAVGRPGTHLEDYVATVLTTFVWAYPHQYRVPAEPGTCVDVDLDAGGRWHLRSVGGDRWTLEPGEAADGVAGLAMTSGAAWRCLTAAAYDESGVRRWGPSELTAPLLLVRGIIV